MYSNIVVPLDGSEFSERALPWARTIVRRSGGALRLVHVHIPLRIPTCAEVIGPRVGEQLRQMKADAERQERAYLEVARSGLEPEPASISTAVLRGPIAPSVADHAATEGATLIVIATHARPPLDRVRLGSITDEIVRRCQIPVLIVRGEDHVLPGPNESAPVERVVVPLDGRPRSERSLSYGVELARLFDAEVVLVRVVRSGRRTEREDALGCARQYLRGVVSRLDAAGVVASFRNPESLDVADAVAEVAEEAAPGVVVMASRYRSGLSRLVLGNIAEELVRKSPVPVLVVGSRTHIAPTSF